MIELLSRNLNVSLWSVLLIFISLTSCKDNCKDKECLNGGICDDGTCLCPDDYTGNQCQYIAVSALYGEYNCGAECSQSQNGQPMIGNIFITASPSGGNNIIISFGQLPLNASVSGNNIIIEDYYYEFEDFQGNIVGSDSIVAEGHISNGIIYIHYESEHYEFGNEYFSTCEFACPIDL